MNDLIEHFVTIVHVVVALFMILVVLVQGGNTGGVSAALGGGSNSGSAFGASGATTLLGKLTYGAAAIFMISSVWLTKLEADKGDAGLADDLEKKIEQLEADKPATEGEMPATDEGAATETQINTDENTSGAESNDAGKAE